MLGSGSFSGFVIVVASLNAARSSDSQDRDFTSS
jgi:hypothetical protein